MTIIFKNEYSTYAVDVIPLLLKCVEKCSQSSQVCKTKLLKIVLKIEIKLYSYEMYAFIES